MNAGKQMQYADEKIVTNAMVIGISVSGISPNA
jgi:hypothetical protein